MDETEQHRVGREIHIFLGHYDHSPVQWAKHWLNLLATVIDDAVAAGQVPPEAGVIAARCRAAADHLLTDEAKTRELLADLGTLANGWAPVPATPPEIQEWIDEQTEVIRQRLEAEGRLDVNGGSNPLAPMTGLTGDPLRADRRAEPDADAEPCTAIAASALSELPAGFDAART
jgi:hypothetical protein